MGIAFQNGSAILRLTMTDNFNYQDVFKTNIPELDQNITLHAQYLLGAAQNIDFEDLEISQHLRSHIDSPKVTQAIWELNSANGRSQRLLAITVMGDYFRIGLDCRPTSEQPVAIRWSANGHRLSGPSEETLVLDRNGERSENFYDVFYETVAALGLQHRLQQVYAAQKESSSAIFANAA